MVVCLKYPLLDIKYVFLVYCLSQVSTHPFLAYGVVAFLTGATIENWCSNNNFITFLYI